jgi:hypothetical protein
MTKLEKTKELLTELEIVFTEETEGNLVYLIIEADKGPRNHGGYHHGTTFAFNHIGDFCYTSSWKDD